jgi:hypothetical protein
MIEGLSHSNLQGENRVWVKKCVEGLFLGCRIFLQKGEIKGNIQDGGDGEMKTMRLFKKLCSEQAIINT